MNDVSVTAAWSLHPMNNDGFRHITTFMKDLIDYKTSQYLDLPHTVAAKYVPSHDLDSSKSDFHL